MHEPAELTLVALDPGHTAGLAVDRIAGDLDADGMAALYRETDVLVKLSRVESLGLPPLEAFHAGVPSVVTPYTGHDEYLVHGVNGAVVGFDDPGGVAAWLDRLAADRALLARLSDGARETAAAWPGQAEATRALAGALRELAAAPPAAGGPAMSRALRRAIESGREQLRQRDVELAGVRGEVVSAKRETASAWREIDRLNDLVGELEASRAHLNDLLLKAEADLDAVRASRAYRAAVAARRVVRRRG
jgi:hypothetical protein